MSLTLIALLSLTAILSFLVVPRVRTAEGFFRGTADDGRVPGVVTLVLSQVTTWVFARSLLNAAILGYLFGIAGALAYTAYFLSFLTGGLAVDRLRFRHGCTSIQQFMQIWFGRWGTVGYNLVVVVRLISEVFANLLVVGIIFGAAGSEGHFVAILVVAVLTLGYSALGGLSASLRTDVLQMSLLAGLLMLILVAVVGHSAFDGFAVLSSSPDLADAGWWLLLAALLQVWSYPLHDPVMMDRGFLADRATTRRSFLHACWLSCGCVLVFGILGVFAGLERVGDESLMESLERLIGTPGLLLVNLALILSAVSTLDSTFSSAAKLAVVDMRLAAPTAWNGRIAMFAFFLGGLAFLHFGTDDLFAAVALSGTASLFLAPVLFFCILGRRRVAPWCFPAAFSAAMLGAVVYFLETGGYAAPIELLVGPLHDYGKLLLITLTVLGVGCAAFFIGLRREAES